MIRAEAGAGPLLTGFAPVAAPDARVLILGSLPGTESLAASRYYAHPRNQFWPLIGTVIGCDLALLSYAERLERLLASHIALWDSVAAGHREGSLDTNLKPYLRADLPALVAKLPLLRAVAFNGACAARLAAPLPPDRELEHLVLPSSSPANTAPLAVKQDAWNALRPLLDLPRAPLNGP